jgi:hypothetical protein
MKTIVVMKSNAFSKLGIAGGNRITRLGSPRWLVPAALALSCTSITFVASGYNTSSPISRASAVPVLSNAPMAATPISPAVAQAKTRELVKTVRFNLYDLGILPREVHVQKGILAITIEDYSGGTTGLIIERENGNGHEQAGRVDRAGGHWRGRSELRFSPGRYRLSMEDRPANRALLVVEP